MVDALSAPFAVAAIVLCVAGLAKLRSPRTAVRVMAAWGLPARSGLIRSAASGELVLGLWCVGAPGRLSAAALAVVYATFAGLAAVAVLTTRRAASCGCFGDRAAPLGAVHCLLSITLALVAGAGAIWVPHGLSWVISRQVAVGAALAVGVAGAVYAVVLAYTELPGAWRAWSPR